MKTRKQPKSGKAAEADLHVIASAALHGAVKRAFPGPHGAKAPLRVALDRAANDDIAAHARESPDAEVCGVLVGNVCQDEEGVFTHVSHSIRGEAAAEGSTHVTFTQATWTAIHATMDRDHAGRQIVGWYHTHPGFGVEFSDMDTFIQRNFFSGPAQIALVTDPTDGAVALAMNGAEDIAYLDRYWVEGREQKALLPESMQPAAQGAGSGGSAATAGLEERVAQLTQAVDDLRSWIQGVLLATGLAVCIGIIFLVGSVIREQFRARVKPPEMANFIQVPVKVGDKNVLMGVGVVNWEVPPELNAIMLDMAREEKEAARKAAEKDAKKKGKAEAAPADPAAPNPPPTAGAEKAPAPKPPAP